MGEQLTFCAPNCGVKEAHGHAYGAIYYGTQDQLRRAWKSSRGVREKQLRVSAFEKIQAHILGTEDA